MTQRYAHYEALKFNRPEDGILEVILSAPKKLNALDATGHEIVGPDALVADPPALVLVMNPNYEAEITESVRSAGIDVLLKAGRE